MSKKKITSQNYLEFIPHKNTAINWSCDESGMVTLEIENKGAWNRIFQVLLKKPKITYIHLDEMGSFIWPLMDGERDILEIGKFVEEHFGEKANPLYERLSQFAKTEDGFKIAEMDLETRGAGNLEGGEQSGSWVFRWFDWIKDKELIAKTLEQAERILDSSESFSPEVREKIQMWYEELPPGFQDGIH